MPSIAAVRLGQDALRIAMMAPGKPGSQHSRGASHNRPWPRTIRGSAPGRLLDRLPNGGGHVLSQGEVCSRPQAVSDGAEALAGDRVRELRRKLGEGHRKMSPSEHVGRL